MRVQEFQRLYMSGSLAGQHPDGLIGRILRGVPVKPGENKPDPFKTLTDTPETRRVIFLADEQGLGQLVGKGTLEQLDIVGYDRGYTKSLVESGHVFKLVVFEADPRVVRPAYWYDTLDMVAAAYPDVANAIQRFKNALRTTPIWVFEKMAGISFAELEKMAKEQAKQGQPQDSRWITYDRLKAYGDQVGSYHVRCFLYSTCFLRELYSGDSYAYDNLGNRGTREYVAANRPLTDLGNHIVIDLPTPSV